MTLRVLVEGVMPERPGHVAGTSCRAARVELPADADRVWNFVTVTAGEVMSEAIQGIVEET